MKEPLTEEQKLDKGIITKTEYMKDRKPKCICSQCLRICEYHVDNRIDGLPSCDKCYEHQHTENLA